MSRQLHDELKSAAPDLVAPVEQPVAEPSLEPGSAAMYGEPPPWDRTKLRWRIADLVEQGHEQVMRQYWPENVPTLKHDGHTDAQLQLILAAVRRVETEVGAPFVPGDVTSRSGAIRRALKAWEGRDPGTAWFAASLIATFEQCRNADATFEELVAQFTVEQADRLYESATQYQ